MYRATSNLFWLQRLDIIPPRSSYRNASFPYCQSGKTSRSDRETLHTFERLSSTIVTSIMLFTTDHTRHLLDPMMMYVLSGSNGTANTYGTERRSSQKVLYCIFSQNY